MVSSYILNFAPKSNKIVGENSKFKTYNLNIRAKMSEDFDCVYIIANSVCQHQLKLYKKR